MTNRCRFLGSVLVLLSTLTFSQDKSTNESHCSLPDDFTTKNGFFVKYRWIPNTDFYVISWGNHSFTRQLDKIELGNEQSIPRYAHQNDKVVILSAGCGSPCWFSYVLPLNAKDSVRMYSEPVAFDMKYNLVVCVNGKDSALVDVNNFVTGACKTIYGDRGKTVFLGWSIDSVSITNRQLYFRWFTEEDFDSTKRATNDIRENISF